MRLPLLLALLVLLCGPALAAQDDPADPRNVDDPRTVRDPRDRVDPRDPRVETLSPDHPAFRELAEAERLIEGLYEAGNEEALLEVVSDALWDIGPYLRQELSEFRQVQAQAHRSPEAAARAEEQQGKLLRVAQLADRAARDTRFSRWIEQVVAWTPEHRTRAARVEDLQRQARVQIEAARRPEELLQALTPLRQALDEARQLGHTQAMASVMAHIADIQFLNGAWEETRAQLEATIRIGREVRERAAVWDSYETLMQTHVAQGDGERARDTVIEWYDLALQIGDEPAVSRAREWLVNFATADYLPGFFERMAFQEQVRARLLGADVDLVPLQPREPTLNPLQR